MAIHIPTTLIKGGLVDKGRDFSQILANESPNMLNVIKYNDEFGQRPGTLSYGSVSGIVMQYYHFKVGDTNRFLCFTNSKIYYKTQTGWTDITGANLTGSISDMIDVCTVYDDTLGTFYIVFTNGKDNIRKYTGSGNTEDMSGWTSYQGKFVRYYQGYLVVANILSSGTWYPYQFKCSHTDNPNDLSGVNSKTFNLSKDRGISEIMRVEHFGNFLLFYKRDCIYGAWLGSSLNVFEFDVWIHKVGLRASRALAVDNLGAHIFLGNDDIYYWQSRNTMPQGIGTSKVRKRIFEDTSPENLKYAWAVYDGRHNHIKFYVPETFYPTTIYDLDLNDGKWTWWKSERTNITAVGTWIPESIVTIDELVGTIDDQTGTIDELSGALEDNFPIIIEGKNDGTHEYYDDNTYNDLGTAIDSYQDTNDDIFINAEKIPFSLERIQGMKVEAKGLQSSGDRLYVYYSTDEGSTWTQITTGLNPDGTAWTTYIELSDEWQFYECHFDVVTDKIRYRFRNAIVSSTWRVRKLDRISAEREED